MAKYNYFATDTISTYRVYALIDWIIIMDLLNLNSITYLLSTYRMQKTTNVHYLVTVVTKQLF